MGSFLMERIFWSTPNRVLMANTECATEAFSTTCAVHIKDWRLFSCRGSVAEYWRLKPVLCHGSTPGDCQLFCNVCLQVLYLPEDPSGSRVWFVHLKIAQIIRLWLSMYNENPQWQISRYHKRRRRKDWFQEESKQQLMYSCVWFSVSYTNFAS